MVATFPLPVDKDSSYSDDGADASVKQHQEEHDLVHGTLNSDRCLAWLSYGPGSNADTNTVGGAGAAPTAVDATNLAITFVAPSSGKVKVTLSGACYTLAAASSLGWCLLDTSNVVITNTRRYMSGSQAAQGVSYTIIVTGLTPGTSYTYRWGHYNIGGSGGATIYGNTGASGSYGPAIMEVRAVP